jgi:aminoacrylate hydrolase
VGGLHYETHGRADAPPLILSSGLGGSAQYWAPNIAALAKRFHVIAYDHRGTGRSDRAALASLSIDDMADDVVMLLDHLDVARAHLLGHALGGLIGMTLALRRPERLHRLVVVNGWARLEAHTARCFDARLALLRRVGVGAYIAAQPIFLYPANWLTLNADVVAAELAAQRAHFPDSATVEQRIAAIRAFDVHDRMGEITVPMLAVSSEDDILVPSIASSRMIERLDLDTGGTHRGGTHWSMGWGGHACNVTDPDTFDAVVPRWIADGVLPED